MTEMIEVAIISAVSSIITAYIMRPSVAKPVKSLEEKIPILIAEHTKKAAAEVVEKVANIALRPENHHP